MCALVCINDVFKNNWTLSLIVLPCNSKWIDTLIVFTQIFNLSWPNCHGRVKFYNTYKRCHLTFRTSLYIQAKFSRCWNIMIYVREVPSLLEHHDIYQHGSHCNGDKRHAWEPVLAKATVLISVCSILAQHNDWNAIKSDGNKKKRKKRDLIYNSIIFNFTCICCLLHIVQKCMCRCVSVNAYLI